MHFTEVNNTSHNLYRGHSEHVVRAKFSDDDTFLFSIGGYDQTIMQWKKKN